MRRFRFHLGTLVILVLFFGVGLAALRESNDTWDSGMFTLTLGVLLTSILLAIHRPEKRRVFWLGFALFGLTYLGLSLLPSIESTLITTTALAYLDSKVPGRPVAFYVVTSYSRTGLNQVSNGTLASNGIKTPSAGQDPIRLWDASTGKVLGGWGGTTVNFVRIGHSLFALLVGWLGGQLSRRLCRVPSDPEPSAAVEAQGTAR
jgi:hypothetical protein